MHKALLIGDFHIPTRARDIPPRIRSKVEEEAYDLVLCTGDLVSPKVLNWLRSLSSQVFIVRGNMDYLSLPKWQEVTMELLRIGLTHGDEVYPRGDIEQLTSIAMRRGVDILVHGHTHVLSVDLIERGRRILLLNPGSATGVWSGSGGSLVPSFMLLIVEGGRATVHSYELKGDVLAHDSKVFQIK
ncbi:MAG: YfcE family phosphodiesterase [Thermoprotei archaeon]|nr:MAG: YfcE family phosphodiesterase [Thermoprotei archaeon]